MTRIKFKAWDKKEKKFNRIISIGFTDFGGKKEFRINVMREHGNVFLTKRECELIQYIGRKDQNDKELYESDFVDFTYVDGDDMDIETSGTIELDLKFTMGYIIREVGTQALMNIVDADLHNIRKVGNIYEDPSLIPISYKGGKNDN